MSGLAGRAGAILADCMQDKQTGLAPVRCIQPRSWGVPAPAQGKVDRNQEFASSPSRQRQCPKIL